MKQTDLIARMSRHALLCGLAGWVGCASSNESDILPGIPADARLAELDDAQAETFCQYSTFELGPAEGFTHRCTDGRNYTFDLENCLTSSARLRETRPDCPTLVRTELSYRRNIHDHCLEPDFDASNYEGQRACTGP